jgi:hypothetical protein
VAHCQHTSASTSVGEREPHSAAQSSVGTSNTVPREFSTMLFVDWVQQQLGQPETGTVKLLSKYP